MSWREQPVLGNWRRSNSIPILIGSDAQEGWSCTAETGPQSFHRTDLQILAWMEGRHEQRQWSSRADFYKLTYTTEQIAKLLGISPQAVKHLEQCGLLKRSMTTRRKLFTARQVERFLRWIR